MVYLVLPLATIALIFLISTQLVTAYDSPSQHYDDQQQKLIQAFVDDQDNAKSFSPEEIERDKRKGSKFFRKLYYL